MQLVLQRLEGEHAGRRIMLRPGQAASVGRTEQADYSFPDDPEMSAMHFAVRCIDRRWQIEDLHSKGGTWVNGQRVSQTFLAHADQVRAGRSVFVVQLGGQPVSRTESGRETARESATLRTTNVASVQDTLPPAAAPSASLTLGTGFATVPIAELARRAQVGEQAAALAADDLAPDAVVATLQQHDLPLDAIRFLAQALPPRDRVRWAARCVRAASGDALEPGDAEALCLADAWVDNPAEDVRRAAHAAAEAREFASPASWVAMAVFWSDGSMSPPQAPVVPADPAYAGQAAAGAVMLAAVVNPPEKAAERHQQFISWGREASGPAPSK
jgi:pSer/pThr/pTyr-binding forkhead associated (FHA) protein